MKFKSHHVEALVYLAGLVALALSQARVRALLGDGWAFAAVFAYLVLLRLVGNRLSKVLALRADSQ